MMDKDYNRLGDWLPRKAKAAGLSFERLSFRAGVSRTSIYNYISDEDRPETETMAKLCRVLGVPLEEGLRQYTPKKRGNPNFGSNNPYLTGLRRRKR